MQPVDDPATRVALAGLAGGLDVGIEVDDEGVSGPRGEGPVGVVAISGLIADLGMEA